MEGRQSGILLPISALPSPFGVGDLGPHAHAFADFLHEAGQGLWQILPLAPTDPAHGNSPYHSTSAFALNPLLLSPMGLVSLGLLREADLPPLPGFSGGQVDYLGAKLWKTALWDAQGERLAAGLDAHAFGTFCGEQAHWLEDFALFVTLKRHFGGEIWKAWPPEYKDRDPLALMAFGEAHHREIQGVKGLQFLLLEQWVALKAHCNSLGIAILGDLPIYVDDDSADVWANPLLFDLDADKACIGVAGVPPDYFSETGQRWGNPLYRWDAHVRTGYAWWLARLGHALGLYDILRIDHFRGLVGFWEIPAGEETAVKGKWVQGPGEDFLSAVFQRFPEARVVAEDLGTITQDVVACMERFHLPGMRVLLFAFGPGMGSNPYAPHNHIEACILYTGTHDNNTVRGWFEEDATEEEKQNLTEYLGKLPNAREVAEDLVRLGMMSVARTAVFPLQDLLGLGAEARMNRPATTQGNWLWRVSQEALSRDRAEALKRQTRLYGRWRG